MAAGAVFPVLRSLDYFARPSINELVEQEAADPGFCSRVPDFVIGRTGYGQVRFLGNTDVRGLDLNEIIRFDRHSVVVYKDEADKPSVGHGLNKAAEVTLVLDLKRLPEPSLLVEVLRCRAKKQGARFLSFNPANGKWKFEVDHFSRFGLVDEEEEDAVMDETAVRQPIAEVRDPPSNGYELELSHSLPAHLGLDPAKMQEIRMAMFSNEEVDEDMEDGFPSDHRYLSRERMNVDSPTSSAKGSRLRSVSPLHASSQKVGRRSGMLANARKEPQALLEYSVNSSELGPSSQGILMSGQNKGFPVRMTKVEGFKMPAEQESPVAGNIYTNCVVDAALFMGRSFRVGWGPNGILVHSGSLVNSPGTGLSSVIHLEKVAGDKVVRDEKNKVKEDLAELCFSDPMDLHRSLDHQFLETESDSFKLKLQKVVANRLVLPDICRSYIDIIERQLEVSDLSMSSRVLLMHQVTVWELVRVLFSERAAANQLEPVGDDDQEGMLLDKKEGSVNIDLEALPLVRRADFSNWLQDSVCHRVQEEVGSLSEARYLEHILLLLTGRQLDTATEVAASRGDVRLAILLSQAGGSMLNRSDLAQQLDLWKMNGLDFDYIEEDRLKVYELLAGSVQAALLDSPIDWKRYLGLIMWYQLSPDTPLDIIIRFYQQLLGEGKVPYPVPVYIDEGPLDEALKWSPGDRFDISFYLMLLHANQGEKFGLLKTMFSAFSSSYDPLDYHMIWHQRSILEAIGAFSSNDLHLLDLSFVYQLLGLGKCHWAIYVILHMPHLDDAPYIHEKLIREILSQYCDSWSKDDAQRQYIVELGIPEEWMHEALALYHEYYGDQQGALENFIQCGNWRKAHTIFMTSVAHSMFLSSKHQEIWDITSALENHKSEIADWDLGAGIYIDYYILKNSLQQESAMDDSDPLEKKNESCRSFFGCLNDSLLVWGSKLPVEARACYSKMAEDLCDLLVNSPGEGLAPDLHMDCFQTMLNAPVPDDHKSSYLQEAVSVFTEILCSDS
ncbi:nuclear pore complex protein NUP96 [Phragmites australis]|uniref:nuclear pore complex protein NUP96 n=1 Tax=Phragmites australis TaxID=29695 RepID=UPI002D794B50|nr:nuclear pore complex protein NUP96 [Phragmites australis]XP_062210055.1 nuclear pore complex protein NUP96 [Phragmites australis]